VEVLIVDLDPKHIRIFLKLDVLSLQERNAFPASSGERVPNQAINAVYRV
jgi:hypothetical protein